MTLKQRREKLLINSYQPPAKGSTSGHGTVRTPGILGNRREATYNEKLRANQSQNLKDLIKSLKYNVRMTPDSFRKLVKKVEKETGQRIVFPNGSKEWAVYNANRNPSRWDRAKKGKIQPQYDITKDTETMNLIGGKILKYNQSLKDPQEVALDKSEAEYEERLSNLGKLKSPDKGKLDKYRYLDEKDLTGSEWYDEDIPLNEQELKDLNQSRMISSVSAMSNKLRIKPTYETMSGKPTKEEPDVSSYEYMAKQAAIQQEKGPASSSVQESVRTKKASDYDKAYKFLQREGPGGQMTAQKMQAINTLDPTGKGTYQTRAIRLYFGDRNQGTE